MATFSENEFREFFQLMGQEYGLQNIPEYINSVIKDWQEYENGRQYEQYYSLPQKYGGLEFEYFIVYHFARYFLDGIQFRASILRTFSNYSEINRVDGRTDGETIFSLDVSEFATPNLDRDYYSLRNVFTIIGTTLLNDTFTPEDFLTV